MTKLLTKMASILIITLSACASPTVISNSSSPIMEAVTALTPTSNKPSISPTVAKSTATLSQIGGKLLVYNRDGILRIDLENNEREFLLERGENWQEWRSSFSTRGDFVAYWISTGSTDEVWLTILEQWSPELLLKLPQAGYDVVAFDWIASDRYLLFQTGVLDEFGVGVNITKAYLFDTNDGQIVSPENWSGDCTTLAVSPRTNVLATWCPIQEVSGDEHIYLVVETNGDIWTAHNAPSIVLGEVQNTQSMPKWAWSLDDETVAFVAVKDNEEKLFLTSVTRSNLTDLSDNITNYYSLLAWSPDGRYISYSGKCPDSGTFCRKIVDILTRRVIWTSQMVTQVNVGSLAWSPDSRHFAVEVEGAIVIADILTKSEIMRMQDLSPINIVWVH